MEKHILKQNEIKITLSTLNKHGVEKINIRSIGKSITKNEIFSTTEADEILEYIERLRKITISTLLLTALIL